MSGIAMSSSRSTAKTETRAMTSLRELLIRGLGWFEEVCEHGVPRAGNDKAKTTPEIRPFQLKPARSERFPARARLAIIAFNDKLQLQRLRTPVPELAARDHQPAYHGAAVPVHYGRTLAAGKGASTPNGHRYRHYRTGGLCAPGRCHLRHVRHHDSRLSHCRRSNPVWNRARYAAGEALAGARDGRGGSGRAREGGCG